MEEYIIKFVDIHRKFQFDIGFEVTPTFMDAVEYWEGELYNEFKLYTNFQHDFDPKSGLLRIFV